jgi:uncharacterized protein YciI
MPAFVISYTTTGSVIVKAESLKEAEEKAHKKDFQTEPSTEEFTWAEVDKKATKQFRKWGKS